MKIKELETLLTGVGEAASDFLKGYDGELEAAKRAIKASQNVRNQIAKSNFSCKGKEFISLGFNCSTAHYLREVGLRTAAYPFDWVFSSAAIISDVVNDSCKSFLDITEYRQHDKVKNISHLRYHEYFFAHKNPLADEADYQYYQRACERLNRIFTEQIPVCFVVTLITEPEKRPGWAMGFSNSFSEPGKQNISEVKALMADLQELNPNISFVIIEHYTECEFDVSVEHVEPELIHIRFLAEGKSTGKLFTEALDDHRFKTVLSGFLNS